MNKRAILTGLMAGVAFIVPAVAQTTDIGEINVQGAPERAPGAGYIIPEDSGKQRSTVTEAAIAQQPATANVFQILSRLPGVNAQSNDATGLFGGQLSIRGFNSDEIGFTIAGVPVNDSGNYAIFPQEYVDGENLQEVDLNQGAPDADQPQGGAVGGAVTIVPQDPTDYYRVKVVQSAGELNFFKSFIRGDTGKLFDGGPKFFISYSKAQSDKWKGPGFADRDHVDFGGTWETEQGSTFRVSSIYNNAVNNSLQTSSLAQIAAFGKGFDFESVFVPLQAPGPGAQNQNNLPAGVTQASDYPTINGSTTVNAYSRANYYKLRVNPFINEIASFTADLKVMDNLHIKIQPYYWNGFGNGGGTSTVAETPSPNTINTGPLYTAGGIDLNGDGDKADTILFYRPSITSTQRPGVNSALTYQPVEWDTIRFGVNFDHSRHHQTQPYEYINADGTVNVFADDPAYLAKRPDGSFLQGRDQLTYNDTTIAFLENTFTAFDDRLKVVTGIKRQEVERDGNNNLLVALRSNNQNVIHPTYNYLNYLPSLQASFHITPEHMVFANLQKNARAPSNFTLYESFSTNPLFGFNITGSQKQETSWNLDLGYRYQSSDILASVSLFAVNFQNRQADIRLDPADSGSVTNINAGTVHNRGVEAEIGTAKPIYDFNLYMSGSYTKSTLQSDLKPLIGQGFYPTRGKVYPNTPRFLLSAVVEYTPSFIPGAFISLSPKWTSSRYSTLVNDEKIPGYPQVDLAAGYRFEDGMFGPLRNTSIQFNIVNLLDRDYEFLGYSASNTGINAKTFTSGGQTFPGSTVFYGIGAPRFFSVKISSEFGGPEAAPAQTAAYSPPPIVAPAAVPKSYLVFFDFNKSDLTPQAVSIVDQAAHNAGSTHVTKLEVTGHTDTVGSDAYNMRLSRRRAESVAAQLEKDGIPSSEIVIFAKGKHDLLVPTADGVKEPQNRRVQIVYSDGAAS
jgi:iron complex outermembrane receptor protein